MARLLACLALLLWSGTATAQQSTTVSAQQVIASSAALLEDGRPVEAANLADLILAVKPNDVEALILRTRAALALGDFPTAVTLSKRAYRATSDSNIKYFTARLAARSHAELAQDSRAQLWLRRARQFAPNEEQSISVARDYRAIAARNPWSTSLRFGISPSSNINNGSEAESITLRGQPFVFFLSEDAAPLSGVQFSAGVSTQYRLNATESSATFLNFSAQGRTYALSPDAKKDAPDVKGSDFSDAGIGIGLSHRRILFEGQQPTDFGVRIGQSWYSGDPYSRTFDIDAGHSWVFDDVGRLGVRVAAQERKSLDNDPDVRTYRLATDWNQTLENGDRVTLGLTYTASRSDILDQDYDGVRLSTNYAINEPFAGLQFGFGFDAERRSFDASAYSNGGREDNNLKARLRVRFTDFEVYGFQPVATVEASRNSSDVDLFDREFVNFGFDLQSSF